MWSGTATAHCKLTIDCPILTGFNPKTAPTDSSVYVLNLRIINAPFCLDFISEWQKRVA